MENINTAVVEMAEDAIKKINILRVKKDRISNEIWSFFIQLRKFSELPIV